MKKQPTVSVLMAVYNTPFTLVKRAIDSVLGQKYQDFELIILDDGSAFTISKSIESYCRQFADKVFYHKHPNCGQSMSINKGVGLSKGRYIAIIDSDDEYKPNHLLTCIENVPTYDLLASRTETVVTTNADYYVPDKSNPQENIHVDDCILFATLFGKKEVFQQYTFRNMYAADSHFFEQASKHYATKKLKSRTYIYYRNIAGSITAKLKEEIQAATS